MVTKRILKKQSTRRATVIAQVAVMSTLIFGFGALAIDVGSMYTVQAELQSMADSSALAAASRLAGAPGTDVEGAAEQAAAEYADMHYAGGVAGGLSITNDVEFGKAVYNPSLDRFTFDSGSSPTDAVRVTARRSEGSVAGPVQSMFANVFGVSSSNLEARAAATLIPRDIVVVIDLSRSMLYDSELRRAMDLPNEDGYANLRDIWAALDGPCPAIPYIPAHETATEYAADTGPVFGLMNEWGTPLDHSYSVNADPGIFYIPRHGSASDSRLESSLQSRGYSSQEIDAILNGYEDSHSSSYRNRVAVALGLADWMSGKPGGKYDGAGGNGNDYVGDSETTNWVDLPDSMFGNLQWRRYIDYMRDGRASSRGEWHDFRYRFGLKTFVDFILEQRYGHDMTPGLACTPQQPLRAVKDAVQAMSDYIQALDSPDQVGLTIFATTAPPPEVYLTDQFQAIPQRLYQMQAGHYDIMTNIGGGMSQARAELRSGRARSAAKKIMVVMSDGYANTGEDGMGGRDFARYQAELAADDDIVIYTVSVGYGVDRALMQEIAATGKGQEFYAFGNPEEYSEQLREIFRSLGGKRPVVLIQ